MRIEYRLIVAVILLLGLSARGEETISLAGSWRFRMGGPARVDSERSLPSVDFADTIELPGTTESNKKGPQNTVREEGQLTRLYRFDGPAWYQRDIEIPSEWMNKRVSLYLERTKYTQLWLQGGVGLGSGRPPPGAPPVNTAVNTAWTYLIAAGLFEIGSPRGLKWAQQAQRTPALVAGIVVAIVAMGISGVLLYLAQKEISLGTSYAVCGPASGRCIFLIGVVFFGDPNALGRWLGVGLIIAGVATLKLAH